MMMRKAKGALAGQWVSAVVATLILMVILGAVSATYLGELVLYGPLMFGYILFMMCLVDTRVSNMDLLFKGFSRFVETLVAGLIYTVAVSIGSLLLIVPGIIVGLGLSMTIFIMAEDDKISGIDALQQSWNMMQGHKMELFMLNIRFIGWGLLCLLTCGIGYLWLMPYMYVTNLYFYRQLRYGSY